MPHLKKSRKWRLVMNLVPPCSTFSRARDRPRRTRVRSMRQPGGNLPGSRTIIQANTVARRAAEFAVWANNELKAAVSLEQSDKSYMWTYARHSLGDPRRYQDTRLSYCMYGRPYKRGPA